MTEKRLHSSFELTINEVLKINYKIEGKNNTSLQYEFGEWIEAI
tara:strand:+ start:228 stop:359 length:132 start_codon:yes stop_codon:yes gene_type:complete